MLTAWPSVDHAIILAIGPHDRRASDVYELILVALEVEVPQVQRDKPSCCDELGSPPADSQVAEALADAVDALARRASGLRRSRR